MKKSYKFFILFFILVISIPNLQCVGSASSTTPTIENQQDKLMNYFLIAQIGLSACIVGLMIVLKREQKKQINPLKEELKKWEEYGTSTRKSYDELKKYYEDQEKNRKTCDDLSINLKASMAHDLKRMALEHEELNALSLAALSTKISSEFSESPNVGDPLAAKFTELEMQQKLTRLTIKTIEDEEIKVAVQALESAKKLLQANDELISKIQQLQKK